ncbi:hypothetical protein AX16_003542 [Volvariella volvacea WC 439]|nr:hypothetical protein AX16_003542 [Volvariella volvacea WC 439]
MMRIPALLGLLVAQAALGFVVGEAQIPFLPIPLQDDATFPVPHRDPEDSSSYKFKWPIKKVAIIGAGPGGLIAYRELTRAGFDAYLFERDHAPGGNWHYSDEIPVDAPIPNADVSIGDYIPDLPPQNVRLPFEVVHKETEDDESYKQRRREFRGPKPLWKSLNSNAPAPHQQIAEWPWPAGTPWELPHATVQKYLRAFASWHGVNVNDENPNVSYNTRVELVEKRYDENGKEAGWKLVLKEIVREDSRTSRTSWREENFDAVVVATGRWNAPYIPPIPGLIEWSKKYGNKITHSRQYRHPQGHVNETLLVIGAATSGGEISRDIIPYAKKIYQSIRPDRSGKVHFNLPDLLHRLPKNVTIIGEIKKFRAPTSEIQDAQIELTNGTIITGVDRIIFATGYRYSFPFLHDYHNSSISLDQNPPRTEVQPIVTDGTHLRALHLDLFYIPDPTLALLNMNVGMQSFTYGEYLSLALAKVWSGTAHIPDTPELWRLHEERVKVFGGYGRHFQFLGAARTRFLLRYFIGWLNSAAYKYGGRQINQISPDDNQIVTLWAQARYGSFTQGETRPGSNLTYDGPSLHLGATQVWSQEERDRLWDTIVSDWW